MESLLAQNTTAKYFMLSIPLVLHHIAIVGVCGSVDIYAMARLKPIIGLAFETAEILKQCIVSYHLVCSRTTVAVEYYSG